MNIYELYDNVRGLDNLSDIKDIERACKFAKMAILREKIENAIKEAHTYGFAVEIDYEPSEGVVTEVKIPVDNGDNWGVVVK